MDTRLVKASGEQRLMEWAPLVVECRSSKLSRKEWCAQHGISERKYHYWQKRVFDCAIIQRESTTMAIQPQVEGSQFAELPAPQETLLETLVTVASIRIGNAAVELYSGADPGTVKAICQALKSC